MKEWIRRCHVTRIKITSTVGAVCGNIFGRSCKKKSLEVVTGRTRLSSTADFHRSEFMGSGSGLTYSKSMIIILVPIWKY